MTIEGKFLLTEQNREICNLLIDFVGYVHSNLGAACNRWSASQSWIKTTFQPWRVLTYSAKTADIWVSRSFNLSHANQIKPVWTMPPSFYLIYPSPTWRISKGNKSLSDHELILPFYFYWNSILTFSLKCPIHLDSHSVYSIPGFV